MKRMENGGCTDLSMLGRKLEDFLGGGYAMKSPAAETSDPPTYDSDLNSYYRWIPFFGGREGAFCADSLQKEYRHLWAENLHLPWSHKVHMISSIDHLTRQRWFHLYFKSFLAGMYGFLDIRGQADMKHTWDNSCRRAGQSRKGRQGMHQLSSSNCLHRSKI